MLLSSCGPSKLQIALQELNISPVKVTGPANLNLESFHKIDTARVQKIISLGVKALDAELKHVGTRRSAETSVGPIIRENSYATHWNEYMMYLVQKAAEKGEPGSSFRILARDIDFRSQNRILFSFAFNVRSKMNLKNIPIVLTNDKGHSVSRIEVGYQTINKFPYSREVPEDAPSGVRYLIEGRFLFPSHDKNGNPLIYPEVEFMEITILPGSAIHKFKFNIIQQ